MSRHDATNIGDIYGKMLNTLRYNIQEKAKTFEGKVELVGDGPNVSGYNEIDGEYTGKKGTRTKQGKKFKITKSVHNKNGDEDEETKAESAMDKIKEKLKNKNLSSKQRASLESELKRLKSGQEAEQSEESFSESKKIITNTLNNFMSKSVFDKLYSKVLRENFGQEEGDDLDALGLDDATPDSDMDEDFGAEDDGGEGDSVTFTLPREIAQQLIDVLQASIGEEEGGLEDEGDDLDFGDDDMAGDDMAGDEFGEEDEEEGTEVAPTGTGKKLQAKPNKVQGFPSVKSGKAKADVTDETGTKDGAPPITALQGKNNQVPGSTLKKATDYFR